MDTKTWMYITCMCHKNNTLSIASQTFKNVRTTLSSGQNWPGNCSWPWKTLLDLRCVDYIPWVSPHSQGSMEPWKHNRTMIAGLQYPIPNTMRKPRNLRQKLDFMPHILKNAHQAGDCTSRWTHSNPRKVSILVRQGKLTQGLPCICFSSSAFLTLGPGNSLLWHCPGHLGFV